MSILLAVTGWNPQHWLDALKTAAPGRTVSRVVTCNDDEPDDQ